MQINQKFSFLCSDVNTCNQVSIKQIVIHQKLEVSALAQVMNNCTKIVLQCSAPKWHERDCYGLTWQMIGCNFCAYFFLRFQMLWNPSSCLWLSYAFAINFNQKLTISGLESSAFWAGCFPQCLQLWFHMIPKQCTTWGTRCAISGVAQTRPGVCRKHAEG